MSSSKKVPADLSDERLETIAKDIESTGRGASLHIAARLVEARDIFRYRRDEGGFGGWVETRLHYSRSTAYSLLNVHERFGGEKNLSKCLDTLPVSIVYLLSAPSTPEAAEAEIIERAEAGEKVTVAKAKRVVKRHKPPSSKRKPRDGASIRIPSCAEVIRRTRLGERTVNRLRGTSLGSAAELDALVDLNFGAPDGTHAPIVRKLVTDALAGEEVSAVELTDSAPLPPGSPAWQDVDVITRQARHVQKLNEEIDQLKSRIFELEDELEKSEAEVAALRAELHGKVGAQP
jgi:hypothetical protein